MTGRYRLFGTGLRLLLAANLIQACGEGGNDGTPVDPTPGTLHVRFQSPSADDAGVLLQLTGPAIGALEASPGLSLFESGTSSAKRILLAGPVRTGLVLTFAVPDTKADLSYSVVLEQVARQGTFEQGDVDRYQVLVVR